MYQIVKVENVYHLYRIGYDRILFTGTREECYNMYMGNFDRPYTTIEYVE